MFRKIIIIINASSNLKMSLHLGTKIKSNGCLDIGTEGVILLGLQQLNLIIFI